MEKISKGTIGFKIILDANVDITAETNILKIKYQKKVGASDIKGEWDAEVEDTTCAYYVTQANDLDAIGIWKIQLYAELADFEGCSPDIVEFEVIDTL